MPRHRSSWRRRYGASYYPSRYYARPPRAHYVGGAVSYPARYPANVGYHRAMATSAMVPRGYVHSTGSYMSGGRALMPSAYNMVSGQFPLNFVWSPLALAFITPLVHVHWLELDLERC
ncbi:hypothetical protein BU25DRAFT_18568 [Macroventuria anomochaeta]|uniref:Uncharacterized protein n=1 Tax=Macroventuria anomochaeta TaxID=301207 RepID=A0ACB6S4N7_9PLEO|nr:uncharacterized protein BU25DRAFT_18568 [Macroventuria anomochaeta]KAF2629226.1 hypothetical protein BU25DRAFT_18568 [Macroventuria anomochaeta]